MKLSFTKFVGIAASAAIFLTPLQDLMAAHKRLVIIEEFTSATCGPCVGADPVLAKVVKVSNGVISVRYHQDYPAKFDPMNLNFPPGKDRHNWYNIGGIPASFVNGHYSIDPRDEQTLMLAAKIDETLIYPVAIKVTEDKSKSPTIGVKVEVETEMDLSDYTLHAVVIAKHISLPDLPNTLANSNGQDEFEDAVLDMVPNWQGTKVSIAAGEKKSFDLSYTMKASELYPQNGVYVVAFLQNNKTREIVQAGTSEPIGEVGSLVGTSIVRTGQLPGFSIQDPNGSATAEVTINNNSNKEQTYAIGKSSRTPSDWTVEVDGGSNTVTIPAGGSKKVSGKITKGATTGMGDFVVAYTEGSAPMNIPLQAILSKDVETIQFTDDGDNTYSLAPTVAATGRSGYYDVPTAAVLPKLEELEHLKYVIWNTGAQGTIDASEQFFAMDLLDRGVGMLFAGEAQTYGGPNGTDAAASLHDKLGFQYVKPIRQGYATQGAVSIVGVKDDPITDGFKELGQLINYLTPYIKSTSENTKIILSHQVHKDSSFAARTELDNARAVFFGFSPAVITDAAARQDLMDKALNWIEGKIAAPKPKAVFNINTSQPVDFGKVKVGESHDVVVEIKAANGAGLEITDISDFRENFGANNISLIGLPSTFPATPITLTEGQKFTFTLRYAPTAVGTIDQGDDTPLLSISTNEEDGGIYNLELKGEATQATSVAETASNNGAFSISAGPNPFVGSSVVRYSLNDGAAKSVRIALFNEQGREVAVLVNGVVTPGAHTVALDGTSLAAGMYRAVMTVDGESVSLPVVRLK